MTTIEQVLTKVSVLAGSRRFAELERLLDRALDPEGVPRRWPVGGWWAVLSVLDRARVESGDDWPEAIDARLEGLLRSTVRMSRPDGSSVFEPGPAPPDRRAVFRRWVDRLADPGLETVAARWFRPRRGDDPDGPPPLPAMGGPGHPLAMLRADWSKTGDFLAVDGRGPGADRLELAASGRAILGPGWLPGGSGRPRNVIWRTGYAADFLEWTVSAGTSRITKTAVLLRGRNLALLAVAIEGPAEIASTRVEIPPGGVVSKAEGTRSLVLDAGPRLPARIVPLALPSLPYETDRGAIAIVEGGIEVQQKAEGRRAWLPLLVSWDRARDRKPLQWRALTVSEKSRVCAPTWPSRPGSDGGGTRAW